MLPCADTEDGVEVDVVIHGEQGPHDVLISVEVVEEKRRATRPWVDSMIGKHRSLPTDRLVLVSKSGFSKNALKKARANNVVAWSLSDVTTEDWAKVVTNFEFFELRIHVQTVQVKHADDQPLSGADIASALIHDADQNPIGTIEMLVEANVARQIAAGPRTRSSRELSRGMIKFNDGIHLVDHKCAPRYLRSLAYEATITPQLLNIELEPGQYGPGVDIARGYVQIGGKRHIACLVRSAANKPPVTAEVVAVPEVIPPEEKLDGSKLHFADLAVLPMRALAAWTARIGRRVQPLYRMFDSGPGPPRFHFGNRMEAALRVAERYAIGGAGDGAEASVSAIASMKHEWASAAMVAAQVVAFARVRKFNQATRAADMAMFMSMPMSMSGNAGLIWKPVQRAARRDLDKLLLKRLGSRRGPGVAVDPSEDGPLGSLWAPDDGRVAGFWPGLRDTDDLDGSEPSI